MQRAKDEIMPYNKYTYGVLTTLLLYVQRMADISVIDNSVTDSSI